MVQIYRKHFDIIFFFKYDKKLDKLPIEKSLQNCVYFVNISDTIVHLAI